MALALDTAIQAWAGTKARLAKWERASLELGEKEGKWEKAGGRENLEEEEEEDRGLEAFGITQWMFRIS